MDVITVSAATGESMSNAYLATGSSNVLVDTGTAPGVVDAIDDHVADLDAVVLTHGHYDHVDQLDAVVDAFDPAVYAFGEVSRRTKRLRGGQSIELGDVAFTVVHTPGHAPDHVCLVGESALFSGDIVVYNDGAFDDGSFGRTDLEGASRDVLIESLERLLDVLPRSVEAIYPGHGDVHTGDIHAVIERALTRARRHEPKYPEE